MGGALAGMVDEGDGGVVVALQGAEIGQESATSPATFSSMACRRTKGSRTRSFGCR